MLCSPPTAVLKKCLIRVNHFSGGVFCCMYSRFTAWRSGCGSGEEGPHAGSVPRGSVTSAALIMCVYFPLSKETPQNRVVFMVCFCGFRLSALSYLPSDTALPPVTP